MNREYAWILVSTARIFSIAFILINIMRVFSMGLLLVIIAVAIIALKNNTFAATLKSLT